MSIINSQNFGYIEYDSFEEKLSQAVKKFTTKIIHGDV